MKLNYLELKKLKKFDVGGNTFNNGGSIYWFNDNILYKIVGEYFFCDEVERNIDLQIKAPIMHTPVIYDKLFFNEDFAGYSMEYLKNSFTFNQSFQANQFLAFPLHKK